MSALTGADGARGEMLYGAVVALCWSFSPHEYSETSFVPPLPELYPSEPAQCGPRCLYMALKLLGREAAYLQLLLDAGTDQRGTSLEGIKRAAEARGVSALAIAATAKQLHRILAQSACPVVAICHLEEPGHFVLLYQNNGNRFSLVDPSGPSVNNDAHVDHLRHYSGAALLLSNDPLDLRLLWPREVMLRSFLAFVTPPMLIVGGLAAGACIAARFRGRSGEKTVKHLPVVKQRGVPDERRTV